MRVHETLSLGADARAVVHLDGAAMVLGEVDDVVVRTGVQDVFLPVDFADDGAVLVDARLFRRDAPEGEVGAIASHRSAPFVRCGRVLSLHPALRFPLSMLSLLSREAEERREARGERSGAEREQVVVEIVPLGNEDMGGDARPRAAPGEAFGRPFPFHVVVAGDDESRDAGRRRECAEAAGGQRGGGDRVRHRGHDGQNRLDPLAHQQRGRRGIAEADGEPVDAAQRLARARHGRLRRARGIEPGPVHAADRGVTGAFLRGAGDGGDQRRQAANAAAVAMEERGVEAERGEAAAMDGLARR